MKGAIVAGVKLCLFAMAAVLLVGIVVPLFALLVVIVVSEDIAKKRMGTAAGGDKP